MQRPIAVLIGCAFVGAFAAGDAEAKAKRYQRVAHAAKAVHAAKATTVKNLADPAAQNAIEPATAQGVAGAAAAPAAGTGAIAAAQSPSAPAPQLAVSAADVPVAAPQGLAVQMPAAAAPLPANPPLPGFLAALFQPRQAAVEPPAPGPVAEAAEAGGVTVVAANTPMRQLVAKHAAANGVPFSLAHAVIMIESKYAARAAHAGNYGLMQIRAETARGMGFRGSAAGLLDPDTNLRFGMKYLALAYKMARGDTCGTFMRYQSGVMTTRMNAANRAYCARARGFMAHN